MEKRLSIIVPVYNAEKFLHKCIDSIIAASDETFEIILVNDGSKDNSGQICDEYAKADDRIIVIHQENAGVISTRRVGVRRASGKYITFVDSDDWVEEQMYTVMLKAMEENCADAVICDISRDTAQGSFLMKNYIEPGLYDTKRLQEEFYPSMLFNFKDGWPGVNPSLCNKLMKKEILEDVIFSVDETVAYGEDALCTYPAMLNAKRIFVLNDVGFYHYNENIASVTNVYDAKLLEKCLRLFDGLRYQFSLRKFDDNNQVNGYTARISLECIRNELIYNKKISLKERIKIVREYVEDERVFPTLDITIRKIGDKKSKLKMKLVEKKKFFVLYVVFYITQLVVNIKRKKYEN